MLFNSLDYPLFFLSVFFLYWFVFNNNLKTQNLFLLIASYFFYSFWDYRFLALLLFSTLLDYFTGLKIEESTSVRSRKAWLWLSITVNVGFLAVFKYYNFFIGSFSVLLDSIGLSFSPSVLNIVLPVGISFYTFHGMSYVLDIYNKRTTPTRNFIDYAVFVCFFPLLVAGPIERATHLLPQVQTKRLFNYEKGTDGIRLILWGLFKKVVVADNCALFVNSVFNNYGAATRLELILGLIFFSFQIYGDFAGYTDIARGCAKLLGFDLIVNFRTPYFSRDIAEFWRRWHISLTSWFKDYLYIPLGGNRHGKWISVRNTFIIFLVSGLWHGANWTFVVWGALHAFYFLPLLLSNNNRRFTDIVAKSTSLPTLKELLMMVATFGLVCFAWLFFRAQNLTSGFDYLYHILKPGTGTFDKGVGVSLLMMLCSVMIIFDWLFRKNEIPFKIWSEQKIKRYSAYISIILLILFYGAYVNPQSFIYFQF
jgi:alginate O-acetyltransferase complex protein AlgI